MRIVLSLCSGLLMGLSLPMQWGHWTPPNLGFLAWVALVPLIIATQGLRPGRAYWTALPGMILAHGIMVYWFYTAVHDFGHLGTVTSVAVTFLGILFLAAISSLAPCLVAWINRRGGHWWAWPLVWAAIEYGRNFDPFLQGFTFCNLIHSQYQYPFLFQIVNLVGPYWFLAIIVLVNVMVARFVSVIARAEGPWQSRVRQRDCVAALAMTASIFVVLFSYGLYSRAHLASLNHHAPWFRVAMVQGNIPQEQKWDPNKAEQNLLTYWRASQELAPSHPDLMIWPEASYPWVYDLKLKEFPELKAVTETPLLLGSITREGDAYYNSAVLLDGDLQFRDVVHKFHLVPFGEYIPYQKLLFFAKRLTREVGNLRPALALRPLDVDGLPMGVLVCYEDTFPEISRSLVRQGGLALINITNDAWYGWSSAATQHLAASVFRAVENGRYLVRATNTGVSAVIGPDGQVQMKTGLYEPALLTTQIRLLTQATLYNGCGLGLDLALPLILGGLLLRARRRFF